MHYQWTVNKTGRYLQLFNFCYFHMMVHHILRNDIPAYWKPNSTRGIMDKLAIPLITKVLHQMKKKLEQLNYIFQPWLRYYYKHFRVNDNYVLWIFSFCNGIIVIFNTIVWGSHYNCVLLIHKHALDHAWKGRLETRLD